jgi:L-cysteate sulfo-lyase
MSISRAVSSLPRVLLGDWPTPFQPLDRLRAALGGPKVCPRLWMKREDLVGLAAGGNKIRKLEFVLALAMSRGADTVINTGGVQSNQVRQTAGAAARLGLRCELLLRRSDRIMPEEYESTGNAFLCGLLGANIHFIEHHEDRDAAMEQLASRLAREGRTACVIPVGASTPEGAAGSALCAEEMIEQAGDLGFDIDWLVTTVGSAGTHAGLLAGFHALDSRTRVLGFDVLGRENPKLPGERIREHVDACCELLGLPSVPEEAIEVSGAFAGEGYALPTPEMLEATKLVARTEGVLLDPVYTGKAMAGLLSCIRQGRFRPEDNVAFLHSGGLPAIFAYRDAFLAG